MFWVFWKLFRDIPGFLEGVPGFLVLFRGVQGYSGVPVLLELLHAENWWEGHQHDCQANFAASSGSMDAAGIVTIFQRSVEKHDLRYTDFLGDGDSKAHNLLVQEAVYGVTQVKKLECLGHVQKRLG